MLADLPGLPEALNHLVLTRDELAQIPATDIVSLLYRFFLDRAPDAAGLAQLLLMLDQGMSVDQAAAAIAQSDEAQAKATGRRLIVLDSLPAGADAGLLASYRRLQEMELARLYDFARLVSFLDGAALTGTASA